MMLQATLRIAYSNNPERLWTIGQSNERINSHDLLSCTTISLQHRLNRYRIQYRLKLQTAHQKLSAQHSSDSDVPSWREASSNKVVPEARIILTYDRLKWHTDYQLGLSSWRGLRPVAKASVTYDATVDNKITFSYELGQQLPELHQTVDGSYYNSYRTLRVNDFEPATNSRHTLFVHDEYANATTGRFMSATLGCVFSHTDHILETGIAADSLYYRWYMHGADYYTQTHFASVRLGKTWSTWRSTLNLRGNYTGTENRRLINDTRDIVRLQHINTGLYYSCRPQPWLSPYLSVRWFQTTHRLTSLHTSNDVEYRCDLSCPINKKWRFSLNNAIYQQLEHRQLTYFADCSIHYSYKHIEWDITLNNLLNHRYLVQTDLTTYSQSTSRFWLRPREILLHLSFGI